MNSCSFNLTQPSSSASFPQSAIYFAFTGKLLPVLYEAFFLLWCFLFWNGLGWEHNELGRVHGQEGPRMWAGSSKNCARDKMVDLKSFRTLVPFLSSCRVPFLAKSCQWISDRTDSIFSSVKIGLSFMNFAEWKNALVINICNEDTQEWKCATFFNFSEETVVMKFHVSL